MAHAALHLQRITALIDHEGGGRVAKLVELSGARPAASTAGSRAVRGRRRSTPAEPTQQEIIILRCVLLRRRPPILVGLDRAGARSRRLLV